MKRRILSALLALLLATGNVCAMYHYEPEKAETPQISFSDIGGHWAKSSIEQACADGLVEGVFQCREDFR